MSLNEGRRTGLEEIVVVVVALLEGRSDKADEKQKGDEGTVGCLH